MLNRGPSSGIRVDRPWHRGCHLDRAQEDTSMQARHLYSRVGVEADLESLDEARRATTAVLRALRDRLTRDEADHAAAQLPRELKRLWAGGPPPTRSRWARA
jgi:uncharacterized protein (DUF2267 family)